MARPPHPPGATIALVSPCGWGNLGDAAIVESLIHGVRQRVPGARLIAFTLGPDDTSRRHGIEAYPCVGHALPFYAIREAGDNVVPRETGSAVHAPPLRRLIAVGRSALRRIPIRGTARVWASLPARLFIARGHWAVTRERLRGASMVVVAGGGQLDGEWGGAFGHPYVLMWFGRLARDVGARYVFASVGTGGLSPLSRAIVLRALRLADYRSYRDRGSRDLLRAPTLTKADAIVPDLAYGLPIRVVAPPSGARLVIGLSPMHFARPGSWPRPEEGRYRAHVEAFGDLAARLLEAGHEVVIFSTSAEEKALDDVYALAARAAPGARTHLSVAPTPTLDAVFAVLARVDAVVASRLHGVVLAHVAHRPVLAVAHERKVRAVMEELGQARYVVDLDRFDPADGMGRLEALLAERATLGSEIAAQVADYRRRVLAQYDLLFGPAAS